VKLEAFINMHEAKSAVMPVSRKLNGFTIRNEDRINAETIEFTSKHASFVQILKKTVLRNREVRGDLGGIKMEMLWNEGEKFNSI
jgi:hypothetical protein